MSRMKIAKKALLMSLTMITSVTTGVFFSLSRLNQQNSNIVNTASTTTAAGAFDPATFDPADQTTWPDNVADGADAADFQKKEASADSFTFAQLWPTKDVPTLSAFVGGGYQIAGAGITGKPLSDLTINPAINLIAPAESMENNVLHGGDSTAKLCLVPGTATADSVPVNFGIRFNKGGKVAFTYVSFKITGFAPDTTVSIDPTVPSSWPNGFGAGVDSATEVTATNPSYQFTVLWPHVDIPLNIDFLKSGYRQGDENKIHTNITADDEVNNLYQGILPAGASNLELMLVKENIRGENVGVILGAKYTAADGTKKIQFTKFEVSGLWTTGPTPGAVVPTGVMTNKLREFYVVGEKIKIGANLESSGGGATTDLDKAKFVWYIKSTDPSVPEQQVGTRETTDITVTDDMNGKQIYCQAYVPGQPILTSDAQTIVVKGTASSMRWSDTVNDFIDVHDAAYDGMFISNTSVYFFNDLVVKNLFTGKRKSFFENIPTDFTAQNLTVTNLTRDGIQGTASCVVSYDDGKGNAISSRQFSFHGLAKPSKPTTISEAMGAFNKAEVLPSGVKDEQLRSLFTVSDEKLISWKADQVLFDNGFDKLKLYLRNLTDEKGLKADNETNRLLKELSSSSNYPGFSTSHKAVQDLCYILGGKDNASFKRISNDDATGTLVVQVSVKNAVRDDGTIGDLVQTIPVYGFKNSAGTVTPPAGEPSDIASVFVDSNSNEYNVGQLMTFTAGVYTVDPTEPTPPSAKYKWSWVDKKTNAKEEIPGATTQTVQIEAKPEYIGKNIEVEVTYDSTSGSVKSITSNVFQLKIIDPLTAFTWSETLDQNIDPTKAPWTDSILKDTSVYFVNEWLIKNLFLTDTIKTSLFRNIPADFNYDNLVVQNIHWDCSNGIVTFDVKATSGAEELLPPRSFTMSGLTKAVPTEASENKTLVDKTKYKPSDISPEQLKQMVTVNGQKIQAWPNAVPLGAVNKDEVKAAVKGLYRNDNDTSVVANFDGTISETATALNTYPNQYAPNVPLVYEFGMNPTYQKINVNDDEGKFDIQVSIPMGVNPDGTIANITRIVPITGMLTTAGTVAPEDTTVGIKDVRIAFNKNSAVELGEDVVANAQIFPTAGGLPDASVIKYTWYLLDADYAGTDKDLPADKIVASQTGPTFRMTANIDMRDKQIQCKVTYIVDSVSKDVYSNRLKVLINIDPSLLASTTVTVKKTLPDISGQWAGAVFKKLSSDGNGFYSNQFVNDMLDINDPVAGVATTTNLDLQDYNDGTGTLYFSVKVRPYKKVGKVINDFSAPFKLEIPGFERYTAATAIEAKPDYPKNLRPSQVNVSNVDQYIEIINLPNPYEVQPKTSYTFEPNDATGVVKINLTLSCGVIEDPKIAGFSYSSAPVKLNITITNLKTNAPSSFPQSGTTLDGSSIGVIASNLDNVKVQDFIASNCKNMGPGFDKRSNIFGIKVEPNDDAREAIVSYKIYNYYDERGILINDRAEAKTITNLTINNLKAAITTKLKVKINGSDRLLAQDVADLPSKQILDQYVDVENPPPADAKFHIDIRTRSFNNRQGYLELRLSMINYLDKGSVVSGPSGETVLTIKGFKKVLPSNTVAKANKFDVLPSDVDFKNASATTYIGNYVNNENYPDGTVFTYNMLDIDNSKGIVKVRMEASQWFENDDVCTFNSTAAGGYHEETLLLHGFNTRGPTVAKVNPLTTTPDLIGNIYASDVTPEQAKQYIIYDSLPSDSTPAIRCTSKNALSTLKIEITFYKYYNDKGLLEDTTSTVQTLTITGFKYRGKSEFKPKLGAHLSNTLPSSVSASNWQEFVDTSSFPEGTTFSGVSLTPTNLNGTLSLTAIPDKFYNEIGDLQMNASATPFNIIIDGMKKAQETKVEAIASKDANGQTLPAFQLLPSQAVAKGADFLKQYVTVLNPLIGPSDFTISTEPNKAPVANNILGNINLTVVLNNYYDNLGNPQHSVPKEFHVTIEGFYYALCNSLIYSSNSNITSVDANEFVEDPSKLMNYISYQEQKFNLVIDDKPYDGPTISIVGATGTQSELEHGLVKVTYTISNFFNFKGEYVTTPKTTTITIGGFKNIYTNNTPLTALGLSLLILGIVLITLTLIISLGILFKRKKYYINESYDRGVISTCDSTIPTVIDTREKMDRMRPRLIPLIKEDKPPKPLKQYKPVKQREAKVKPPKEPVLPGQRKREFLEKMEQTKVATKKKIKHAFDTDKRLAINEPFERNGKWYYRDEEGRYFGADDTGNWKEVKKPKKNTIKNAMNKTKEKFKKKPKTDEEVME